MFVFACVQGWYSMVERYTVNTIAEQAVELRNSGIFFDLIVYDTCMMAGIETTYELRDCGQYLIACEHQSPDQGVMTAIGLKDFPSDPKQVQLAFLLRLIFPSSVSFALSMISLFFSPLVLSLLSSPSGRHVFSQRLHSSDQLAWL
jgi:hypothetical protein